MAGFNDLLGSLHAAIILFLPLVVVGLILAFPGEPERDHRMRALGYTVLLSAVWILAQVWTFRLGWPLIQYLVPVACLWAATYIGRPAVHKATCYAILLTGILLVSWFSVLIGGTYVGRPDWHPAERQAFLDQQLEAVRKALLATGAGTAYEFEPGFLHEEDNRVTATFRDYFGTAQLRTQIDGARPLWHTWFTSLYARLPVYRAMYYPGGKIPDGAPFLEWRSVSPTEPRP